MEIWSEVRREVLTGASSKRAAIAKYKVGWHTRKKMLANDEPPGYRQAKQRPKPKLDAFLPVLRQMLEDDGKAPPKQRHTARRIFERLRDEHGYTGGETVVKDAIREWRISRREVFLPLSHPNARARQTPSLDPSTLLEQHRALGLGLAHSSTSSPPRTNATA
jgi:transposase